MTSVFINLFLTLFAVFNLDTASGATVTLTPVPIAHANGTALHVMNTTESPTLPSTISPKTTPEPKMSELQKFLMDLTNRVDMIFHTLGQGKDTITFTISGSEANGFKLDFNRQEVSILPTPATQAPHHLSVVCAVPTPIPPSHPESGGGGQSPLKAQILIMATTVVASFIRFI